MADSETASETTKIVPRPWTLKGVPDEVRNAVIAAAERDNMPLGEWASRAFLAKIQADRQADRGQTGALALIDVGLPKEPASLTGTLVSRTGSVARELDALDVLERTITTAAALGKARGVPAELRRRANAALVGSLPKTAPPNAVHSGPENPDTAR